MIWLGSEYLMFQMPSGESVAFSSDAIAVEIVDETEGELDANMVKQAANAVYHYFKHELGRQTVTVGEFAKAMEKALDGFEISIVSTQRPRTASSVAEADLCKIARDSGRTFELTFFPRLRDELKLQLLSSPNVVRFSGLRDCVKELTGAKRWSSRCAAMEEQIVGYVRECLNTDAAKAGCMLVLD
ncbi:MAG: hypothetical protein MUC91_13560 [Verrucomicrobia bacterium]|jgi:hypothetical protein|nr:hypothetical protein [Verrucomicrobiota bacterium]